MEQYDKVERIAKKAGVSFGEAKQALEDCNWDMLDAVILLEQKGQAADRQQVFSTNYEAQPGYKSVETKIEPETKADKRRSMSFGDKLRELLRKSHVNHLVVSKKEKEIISLPIWAAILIALCLFKITVLLVVIGLFCGCRINLEGPDRKKMENVNKVVNTAGQAMSGAAEAFRTSFNENYRSKNAAETANVQNAAQNPAQDTAQTAKQDVAEEAEVAATDTEVTKTPEQFEKEDFEKIAEGFEANSVSTADGSITLEL